MRVRGQHAPDRSRGFPISSHIELGATGNRRPSGGRTKRDVVHVDEMLAQGLEVHLGPVGRGVGLEDPYHLGDGGVGILA